MIEVPDMTLWACVWNKDYALLDRMVRVMRYTARNMVFSRIVLFTHIPPPQDWEFDAIQCPKLADFDQWNHLIIRWIPAHITSQFAMCVHEDGFPVDFHRWDDRFLDYDWIGAPWADGVVGNGGFYIESRQMLKVKPFLPFDDPDKPFASDYMICRRHRKLLESVGIRFAPADLAQQFSTEITGNQYPSFGFHGRTYSPEKYELGWKQIDGGA